MSETTFGGDFGIRVDGEVDHDGDVEVCVECGLCHEDVHRWLTREEARRLVVHLRDAFGFLAEELEQ